MKIFYGSIGVIVCLVILYFTIPSNAHDFDSFLIVGEKFSEMREHFSDDYVASESAQGRITYSYMSNSNNLTQFAVKNDIIEVVEVYNVFTSVADAMILFEGFSIYLVAIERCRLYKSYNTTMEFIKDGIFLRVEQLPTNYGHVIKFTSYKQ